MSKGNNGGQVRAAKRLGLTLEEWHDLKVEIMELAWDGHSYRSLAIRFNVSEPLVARVAKGGPMHFRARKAPPMHEITPEDRSERNSIVKRMYQARAHGVSLGEWEVIRREGAMRYKAGESAAALAAEYGVGRATVWYWAQTVPDAPPIDEHSIRHMAITRYRSGESPAAIARDYGVHRRTVWLWAKQEGAA